MKKARKRETGKPRVCAGCGTSHPQQGALVYGWDVLAVRPDTVLVCSEKCKQEVMYGRN